MSVIGEGSEFVALMPGALEALVSNIREGFAAIAHTHGTSGIEDGAVTNAKLANLAVSTTKLADRCVSSFKIGDMAVQTGKLYPQAVTTEKIKDKAVTTAKLADEVMSLIEEASGGGAAEPKTIYDADSDGSVEVTATSTVVTLSESPASCSRLRLNLTLGSTSHLYSVELAPASYMYTFGAFVDAYNDGSRITLHVLRLSLSGANLTLRYVGAVSLAGDVLPLSTNNKLWVKSVEVW